MNVFFSATWGNCIPSFSLSALGTTASSGANFRQFWTRNGCGGAGTAQVNRGSLPDRLHGVGAGTGFLLDSGVLVTNAHVVATCNEQTLLGLTSLNRQVRFKKIIADQVRDLAILVPADDLGRGFKIAEKDNPVPGTTVSTWGFPLLYNGTSPLLSVGYVSGYREDSSTNN